MRLPRRRPKRGSSAAVSRCATSAGVIRFTRRPPSRRAFYDGRDTRIGTKVIDPLIQIGGIDNCEVGRLAGFKGPNPVVLPDGAGRVDRGAFERLRGRHALEETGEG